MLPLLFQPLAINKINRASFLRLAKCQERPRSYTHLSRFPARMECRSCLPKDTNEKVRCLPSALLFAASIPHDVCRDACFGESDEVDFPAKRSAHARRG